MRYLIAICIVLASTMLLAQTTTQPSDQDEIIFGGAVESIFGDFNKVRASADATFDKAKQKADAEYERTMAPARNIRNAAIEKAKDDAVSRFESVATSKILKLSDVMRQTIKVDLEYVKTLAASQPTTRPASDTEGVSELVGKWRIRGPNVIWTITADGGISEDKDKEKDKYTGQIVYKDGYYVVKWNNSNNSKFDKLHVRGQSLYVDRYDSLSQFEKDITDANWIGRLEKDAKN